MEPVVRRDANGTWYARLYLGTAPDGRQIRPRRSFPEARTEQEAARAAAEWAAGIASSGRVPSQRLVDLLAEYADTMASMGHSPNSVYQYRMYNRHYIGRFMPAADAAEVTARDVTDLGRKLLARGGLRGRSLAPATVRAVLQYLSGAYEWMQRMGYVERNPVKAAEKPSGDGRESSAMDEADLKALTDWIDDMLPDAESAGADLDPRAVAHAAGIWLALATGMRVGEVCAVRRRDVQPRRGFLRVCGNVVCPRGSHAGPVRRDSPKTASGRRNIALAPSEFERLAAVEAWQDRHVGGLGAGSPVVTVDGSLVRPDSLSQAFRDLRRELGLDPSLTFHSLRHTHATWCLVNGVDPVTLSERLGHASPEVTMRYYGHAVAGRDAMAAGRFAAFIDGFRKG